MHTKDCEGSVENCSVERLDSTSGTSQGLLLVCTEVAVCIHSHHSAVAVSDHKWYGEEEREEEGESCD